MPISWQLFNWLASPQSSRTRVPSERQSLLHFFLWLTSKVSAVSFGNPSAYRNNKSLR
jgi:hypothetical protein